MRSQSTNVTDRQTDRRTTCDRKTAICTIVHRAVIITTIILINRSRCPPVPGCIHSVPENEWCYEARPRPVWRRLPRTDNSNCEQWRHSTSEERTNRLIPACGWTRRYYDSRQVRNYRSIPTVQTSQQHTCSRSLCSPTGWVKNCTLLKLFSYNNFDYSQPVFTVKEIRNWRYTERSEKAVPQF